jgi:hypothetical protein
MDAVCITMPKTLYEFLHAMAVIQDYQVQLAVGAQRGQRDANYQITFRMDEKFKYFEKCLRVVHDNIPIYDYSGWNEEQRGEFDCFINFDDNMFHRAKLLAKVIQGHITSGLGTLIGAGPGIFPVLKPLQLCVDEGMETDVLILNWDDVESEKLYEFISKNYPQLTILEDARNLDTYPVEDLVKYINQFKCIIGKYGSGTYIAGGLKKLVVELFQTTEDGRMYGATGTSNYWAVIGGKHTAEFLWTVWEDKVCPELLLETKQPEEQAMMVQQVSTVVSVDEKSGDKLIPKSEQ